MKASIDHVGIAVGDIGQSLAFFRDALGFEIGEPEVVTSQRVRVHVLPMAPAPAAAARLELLEPTTEDSPVAKYMAKRGPGLHHVALRVDDVTAALEHLKARGVRLIDEAPRPGSHGTLVAFIHPSSTHGVLVELVQDLVQDNE